MRRPGPTAVLGIRSGTKKYQRWWSRLRRRDPAFCRRQAQASLRWHRRNRARCRRLRHAQYWRDPERWRTKSRAYRRKYERRRCHFCNGYGLRGAQGVRQMKRSVVEYGELVERLVLVCGFCRGVTDRRPKGYMGHLRCCR